MRSPPIPGGRLVPFALLVVTVALAHGATVGHGFAPFDDDTYVSANPNVLAGVRAPSVRWALGFEHRGPYFHPLAWLSLMVNRSLLGPEPWGFHLGNVLIHLATAALLALLLERATGRWLPSTLAAALFAVHPLTVEAVGWIAERKTVLSAVFGVGALLAWSAYAERPGPRRMAAALALLAASLLSKPGLNTLPALFLVVDFWPLRRLSPTGAVQEGTPEPLRARTALLEKVPALLLSAALLALAVLSSKDLEYYRNAPPPEGAAMGTGWLAPPAVRLANAFAVVPRYLAAAFWPTGLGILHPYPATAPAWPAVLGVATIAGGSLLAWRLRRAAPWVLAGWGWFLLTLTPFLGLKTGGLWPAWGERFAYFPLMGLCVAVAFSLDALAGAPPARRAAVAALTGVALAALLVACRVQVAHWRSSEALLRRGIAVEPQAAELRVALGRVLLATGRTDEAAGQLEAAAVLAPWSTPAQYLLGDVARSRGAADAAEERYRAALRWDPNDAEALQRIADLLVSVGRPGEARPFRARRFSILRASDPAGR